ncbi:hypothetical protein PYCC9005_002963 [Savitreella phatthalungensis]
MAQKLDRAFRSKDGPASDEVIARTYDFLVIAGTSKGIEQKLVRNLCYVEWSRWHERRNLYKLEKPGDPPLEVFADYEEAIQELNHKHGLALL